IRPKDFDVATSAHPNQVKETFRNSRLIGRRFRLAHVFFRGGKIIEVSTFRANPLDELQDLPQDLLIRHDNVFGSDEEDARRRDFTINGLFYDVDEGRVIDYVGGKDDLRARLIRTIGNPDVRVGEIPSDAVLLATLLAPLPRDSGRRGPIAKASQTGRPAAAEKADDELEKELSELEASAEELEAEDPAQAPLPEGALREAAELHDERLGGHPAFVAGSDVQPWSLPQDVVAPDIVLSEMV